MPKKAKTLSALEVNRLAVPGLYAVGEVPGLHLQVQSPTARSWVLRATVGSKRRDIGLGGFPDVTLAMAREKARAARESIRQGVDPVQERVAKDSALKANQAKSKTFKAAALAYIAAHEAGWRNDKHRQQWENTLESYAYPVMGSLQVSDISMAHVLKVLEPIWHEKTETASRLRGRIEKVMDWAKGRGHRTGDNPAAWKGNLDAQLPRPEKVAKSAHHPALAVGEAGVFMACLRAAEGIGAKALEFTILTNVRSGETRGATWAEIDLEEKMWTIPAPRMKGGREHRVPLSAPALKVLKALPRIAGTDLVFPAPRGGELSDMTLTAVLRRMNGQGDEPRWRDPTDGRPITVHGFRSTFRDWAGELTGYPHEVIEHAMSHGLKDKAEAAYARGTMTEKRRRLMDDWARFCAQLASVSATVIVLERRA